VKFATAINRPPPLLAIIDALPSPVPSGTVSALIAKAHYERHDARPLRGTFALALASLKGVGIGEWWRGGAALGCAGIGVSLRVLLVRRSRGWLNVAFTAG
jgi:hypothetical protein